MLPYRRIRLTKLPILLALLAVLACGKWLPSQEQSPRTPATTPGNREALRSLQERVQTAVSKVSSAVVAIGNTYSTAAPPKSNKPRVFQPFSSGVIITADGLVLSQHHVSHRLPSDGKGPTRSRQPGEWTSVILSDGRKLEAELLGANETFDLSLLQLPKPGPYPHVPLDPSATVKLGDWVLKLGHPLGYRQGRPAVVRLGRVLFQHDDILVTDCLVVGGDSGGPFFDLNGRLVGIIGSSSKPAKPRLMLEDRMVLSVITNQFIQQHIDAMLRREITSRDDKAWYRFQDGYLRVEDDEILPREHWTQGEATARPFQDIIRDSRPCVVSVLDELNCDIALGTIIEANGWIATIASMLPADPRCRLSDGRVVSAQVVGMDPAFDLALLKVPVTGLSVVQWAEKPPLAAGTILAAAGISGNPLAIGVVSVPRRDLPGPFPTQVRRPTIHAQPLWISGKSAAEGYLVDTAGADTNIKQGDIVLTIAGKEIHDERDVHECVNGRLAGERVPVHLIRDGQRRELTMELAAQPLIVSKPYADFPTLFEHDMPLSLSDCGGPVVDLDGKAVGITMYRGQYGCMAVPSDCVQRLLPELMKSGSLADRWVKPPPATAGNHGPAGQDKNDPGGR